MRWRPPKRDGCRSKKRCCLCGTKRPQRQRRAAGHPHRAWMHRARWSKRRHAVTHLLHPAYLRQAHLLLRVLGALWSSLRAPRLRFRTATLLACFFLGLLVFLFKWDPNGRVDNLVEVFIQVQTSHLLTHYPLGLGKTPALSGSGKVEGCRVSRNCDRLAIKIFL